jgi:CRP/FNR family transcriptional regulator, cyclic AMP receptor protein
MDQAAVHWLLDPLPEEEARRLLAGAPRRRARDGALLFRKGDPTPGLHLVEKGAIKIFSLTPEGEERIIDIVGPGEICGEMGIVDQAPSGAWGEALGVTEMRVIPAREFEQAMLASPSLTLAICRLLVARLRLSSRQLDESYFLGARERVLRHLVRLAERHGRAEEGGILLGVQLTHQEIANLAGTARETVSRVLGELQERRLLRFRGRRLYFPDPGALRALTGAL